MNKQLESKKGKKKENGYQGVHLHVCAFVVDLVLVVLRLAEPRELAPADIDGVRRGVLVARREQRDPRLAPGAHVRGLGNADEAHRGVQQRAPVQPRGRVVVDQQQVRGGARRYPAAKLLLLFCVSVFFFFFFSFWEASNWAQERALTATSRVSAPSRKES
jgi:hypothetical protein